MVLNLDKSEMLLFGKELNSHDETAITFTTSFEVTEFFEHD